MSKHRLSSWAGGTILGVAIAGGAAVLAQPQLAQLNPDREGETPVETTAAIQEFSQAFRTVAKAVSPSVVSIEARTSGHRVEGQTQFRGGDDLEEMLPPGFRNDPRFEELFRQFGQMPGEGPQRFVPPQQATGSGVIIDSSGVILTNNHVVAGADEVTVRLADGREFVAGDIKTDPRSDVAVIKIDADNLTPAAVGNSDEAQVGDWVLAIGSPFGLDTTVTAGIVSAKERGPNINEREGFIQTDAAINPGNSGGPLVNLKGQVIGINTAISSRGGGFDGVGFAIPINMAKWVAEQLLESGAVKRSYLGVGIQPMTDKLAEQFGVDARQGVLINRVFEETPAEKAKLQVGDIILAVDGKEVHSPIQLQGLVERLDAGKTAKFKIIRDDETKTVPVTPSLMPGDYGQTVAKMNSESSESKPDESDTYENLGLEVSPLSNEVATQLGFGDSIEGVVVTNVERGSPAREAGLEAGVVIQRVGDTPIKSVDDFRKAIESLGKDAKSVLLLVRTPRGGVFLTLDLK